MLKIENSEVLPLVKSRIWKSFYGDVILKINYISQNLIKPDQIFLKCALHEPSFNLSLVILLSLKKKVTKSVCELGRNTMKHLLYMTKLYYATFFILFYFISELQYMKQLATKRNIKNCVQPVNSDGGGPTIQCHSSLRVTHDLCTGMQPVAIQ